MNIFDAAEVGVRESHPKTNKSSTRSREEKRSSKTGIIAMDVCQPFFQSRTHTFRSHPTDIMNLFSAENWPGTRGREIRTQMMPVISSSRSRACFTSCCSSFCLSMGNRV